jgi:anti-sigma factor RsiW
MVNHLDDEQIQDFLDGNLSVSTRYDVGEHLRECRVCRERVSQYEELFSELAAKPEVKLSKSFTRKVVRRAGRREIGEVQFGLMQVFFVVAGVIAAINALFYFIEWKSFAKIMENAGGTLYAFVPVLANSFRAPMEGVNLQGSFIGLAVGVVILLFLLDRFVLQPRFRSSPSQ